MSALDNVEKIMKIMFGTNSSGGANSVLDVMERATDSYLKVRSSNERPSRKRKGKSGKGDIYDILNNSRI